MKRLFRFTTYYFNRSILYAVIALLGALMLNGCSTKSELGSSPHVKKIDDKHPNPHKTIVSLGNVYLTQRAFTNSLRQYQQALSLYPNDFQVMNKMGYIFDLNQRHDLALSCYQNANLLSKGENIAILNNLAVSLAINGYYSESVKILDNLNSNQGPYQSVIFKNNNIIHNYKKNIKEFVSARLKLEEQKKLANALIPEHADPLLPTELLANFAKSCKAWQQKWVNKN